MIGLGVWGIYKALKHRRQREKEEQEQQGQEMATVEAALGDEEEGGHAQEEEEGRVRRLLQAPGAAAVGAATVAEAEGKAGAGGSNTSSSSDGTWSSPPGDDRGEEEQEEMLRLPRRSNSSSSTGQDGGKAQAAAAAAVGEGEGEEDGGRNNRGHQTPTREPLIFLDEECEEGEHLILRCCKRLHLVDIESPLVQRVVAFVIGIVHGIAGPGGILGVLPAIQLKSWQKASLYLGTFCFASTMIMVRAHAGLYVHVFYDTDKGAAERQRLALFIQQHTNTTPTNATQGIFAALYGELSARVGSAKRMEFQMEVFSASLSIIVGILWISLIIAGKLDLVFP